MNIAVSACLLGEPCRYDGTARPCEAVVALGERHKLVPVCPEVLGGLPVPHPPCEIVLAERALRVVDADGADRTDAFVAGAAKALELVRQEGCKLAVLKAKSPSCGSGQVYDGTFSGTLAPGFGVTARLLRSEGVRVVDEDLLQDALAQSARVRPGALAPLLAASSAECPALETERLVLRPLTGEDVADVFAYCRDADVGNDAGWPPHRTMEDSRIFVDVVASEPHVFGVFEKVAEGAGAEESSASRAFRAHAAVPVSATGPCIGSVGLIADPQRRNPDCLMLGYALAKWAWGKGYMTEAAREVVRYGFEELRIPLLTCTHYLFNDRSRRVIEKCGFVREGTLHAAEASPDGIMRDVGMYFLTAEDWKEGGPHHG